MIHPEKNSDEAEIIQFRTILRYNLGFWGIWWIFYALVIARNTGISVANALFSSTFLTAPLLILSLLLWPFCRKFHISKKNKILFIFAHAVVANLYSAVWLVLYYGVMFAIFGNTLYDLFDVSQTIGWQYPSGIIFYLMVSGAYYALIYYREVRTREIREARLEILLKEAQFMALKNQLNPHFLFNCLNSINALITADPQKARTMLVRLSDLLRLSLQTLKQEVVPLYTELEMIHTYLEIEKIRLGGRLNYQEEVPEDVLDCPVPAMILQPLFENAIKHGIAPSRTGGFLQLQISRKEDRLILEVTNSIPEGSPGNHVPPNSSNNIGLKNLRERLQTLYGNSMEIRYGPSGDNLFKMKINLPIVCGG
ncbi:MAG: hypothetical protein Kow0042_13510 [Calditrichia bacterium]